MQLLSKVLGHTTRAILKDMGHTTRGKQANAHVDAIPVPKPTLAHNRESSHTTQLPIELNSLHYKGQKLILGMLGTAQRVPGR
jgi:hypothetical protein